MARPFPGETPQGREPQWAAKTQGSWPEGEGSRGLTAWLGSKPEGAGTAWDSVWLPIWHDPHFGAAYDLLWPPVWHTHDLAWLTIWHSSWFGTTQDLARRTIWHGHGAGTAHSLAQPRIWPSGQGALCWATQCHLVAEAATVPPCPQCHRAQAAIVPVPPSHGEDAPQPEHPHWLHLLPAASLHGRKRSSK